VTHAQPYSADDYAEQVAPSYSSAQVVLPLVVKLLQPRSVLDIGCGAGAWLASARELGIEDCQGIEGGQPDDDELLVPRESIAWRDLRQPVDLGRRFDLMISLEVAEHLPAEDKATYLDTIERHGDALLFSAAVPGQGGFHHVNEQWPSYWADALDERGFVCFDPYRLALWNNNDVEWWYRQNLLLFLRGAQVRRATEAGLEATRPLHLVHPEMLALYETALKAAPTIRSAGRSLVRTVLRRLSAVARRR
jgi:hypothetical protein